MAKIRDLGISAIPATMRPPEIGDGGGRWLACEACPYATPSCDKPTDMDDGDDKDKGKDKDKKSGGEDKRYFNDAAVAELKQQLRHQLDDRV